MRAAGITMHGELDQVRILEIPEPRCAPGEVVVTVKAAVLNHLDIWMRKGRAGVVLAVGDVLAV